MIVESSPSAEPQADGHAREFAGEAVISPAALADAIGAGLRLETQPRRTLCYEWFDTFDWRLHRAGLILERATEPGRGGAQLLLRDSDGQLLQVAPENYARGLAIGNREACPLDAVVPAGPVRARLAPVVQMRALLPLVRVTARVRTFRAVDAELKTIARIVVEEPIGQPHRLPTPICRLRVVPVRGYENQADKLVRRLTALPGLRPTSGGWLRSALAEIGRRPGDYTGRVDLRLESTMSARAAIEALMGQLLDAAELNMPGVVADLDTEFLHDLRVSVRRARTALKLLGDALPAEVVGRLTVDLKWMGDLTTPTRDLDAYLLAMGSAEVAGTMDEALQPFHAFLRARRQLAQKALVRGLSSPRWARACQRWRDLATADQEVVGGIAPAVGMRPFGEVGPPRIARAYRRATRLGERITEVTPATDLHALRKRCKELRYLLEFCRSLLDGRSYRTAIVQLRALQDCLGEFQDTMVQRAAIDAFADEMLTAGGTSAATIMAMGRASDALQTRQGQTRAQFAKRFKRFANRRTRKRVAALFMARAGLAPDPLPGQS
jgi:CHAD domain-containing protein